MSYMKRELENWAAEAPLKEIVAAGFSLDEAIDMKEAFSGQPVNEEEVLELEEEGF